MTTYKAKLIPCFDHAMRLAQATNITLALASGVSTKTIQVARTGRGIRPYLADVLMQTVCVIPFTYQKRGPKGPRKR